MSVYTKLMQARMMLHGKEIKKSGYNSFAKYAYMELADFLVPTQTIFAELGMCGIVSFDAEIASLTLIDTEDGSQHVITSPMGSAALKGCHEVQNIGAVETYQRRYLWVTAMEIVEHDALDAAEPVSSQGASGAAAKRQSFDGLQPEIKDAFRKAAPQIDAAIPDVAKAIEIATMAVEQWTVVEDVSELKKGLWHLLDSKTRTAIDKVQKA